MTPKTKFWRLRKYAPDFEFSQNPALFIAYVVLSAFLSLNNQKFFAEFCFFSSAFWSAIRVKVRVGFSFPVRRSGVSLGSQFRFGYPIPQRAVLISDGNSAFFIRLGFLIVRWIWGFAPFYFLAEAQLVNIHKFMQLFLHYTISETLISLILKSEGKH